MAIALSNSSSYPLRCSPSLPNGVCRVDRKLCSDSSNDVLPEVITPVNNCMDGTSESISELLHVSNDDLSTLLAHHGDIRPPSDAVSYTDECDCGVNVHSDAVTNDSSSVDDFVIEVSSYRLKIIVRLGTTILIFVFFGGFMGNLRQYFLGYRC